MPRFPQIRFDVRFSLTLSLVVLVVVMPVGACASAPAPSAATVGVSIPAETSASSAPNAFKIDNRLKPNVDFWIDIYSKYTNQQAVVHDAKYINVIYEVVDFNSPKDQSASSPRAKAVKKKWHDALLSVHRKQQKGETLVGDELIVWRLFEKVNEPDKFLNAAHRKRLRYQLGQKNNFMEGLKASSRYLPHFERVFSDAGLPLELTRLPFVESSFNLRARSKVGASGIWQFMRSTGRLYLRINDRIDERNDPIRASEAAARLLKLNYDSLGQWPLAVTAYNHGRKGMMRAVRKVGSDALEDLIGRYKSRSFGFASSNFYACLLAAIEIERHADKYFGPVQRDEPLKFVEVELPTAVNFSKMAMLMNLSVNPIIELNPGVAEQVWRGRQPLPARYRLRLPDDGKLPADAQAKIFLAGFDQIPKIYRRF